MCVFPLVLIKADDSSAMQELAVQKIIRAPNVLLFPSKSMAESVMHLHTLPVALELPNESLHVLGLCRHRL